VASCCVAGAPQETTVRFAAMQEARDLRVTIETQGLASLREKERGTERIERRLRET